MWQKVVKVIKPFLQFMMAFDSHQVHNMLTLILDPYYKSLQIVENYVGFGNTIYFAFKYDLKEIIPLLMTIFERLNLSIQVKVVASINGLLVEEEEETNMFGVGASMEESSWALVIGELSLF
jgi:hypothetical protein